MATDNFFFKQVLYISRADEPATYGEDSTKD